MPKINPHIRFIDKFLSRFQPVFSKKQMSVFREFIYAMFADYKRLSLSSLASNTGITYQKLQYFFFRIQIGYSKTK